MKKYIKFKIRKKYFIIFMTVVALVGGIGGYYTWLRYHPNISIKVVEGGKGEDLRVQTLSVIVAGAGKKLPASVDLNLLNLWIQYNHMNEYLLDYFKTGDIKLHMEVKDDQAILTYSGTGTTMNDEVIDYNNEIVCDFALDADIEN